MLLFATPLTFDKFGLPRFPATFQQEPAFAAPELWNNLPLNIRLCSILSSFKSVFFHLYFILAKSVTTLLLF